MRETIEALGGEYRFQTRVEDFEIETAADGTRSIAGLHLSDGSVLAARHVVLAVGHSARDTFYKLHDAGVVAGPECDPTK